MSDNRGQNKRKYTVNENYFSNMNNEVAYWLGVLYADGNVSTNKKDTTGRIVFSTTDKQWLEDFSKALNYTGPIRTETHKVFKRVIYKVTIDCRKMYEDLVSLGCIPRKSKVIKFPLLGKYVHHFIRGYFDGDGSVTVCKNISSSDWKILKSSFCSGSEDFIRDLAKTLPTKNNKYYCGKRIFEIKLSLKDSISLFNYMYKDSTICLRRKYDKFEEYLRNYHPKGCSTTTISQPAKVEGIV